MWLGADLVVGLICLIRVMTIHVDTSLIRNLMLQQRGLVFLNCGIGRTSPLSPSEGDLWDRIAIICSGLIAD